MINYYNEEEFIKAKKQRKNTLIILFIVLGVYLAFSIGMVLWYLTLPYQDPKITVVKVIHHTVSVLVAIFAFVYLGIPYKRVNKYYKMNENLIFGLKETSVGSFLRYDENVQDKDGVDFKALIFLEWNKYKKDFFERKVLVFYEKPFPELKEKQNVKFVTQGNVLIKYEILQDEDFTKTGE